MDDACDQAEGVPLLVTLEANAGVLLVSCCARRLVYALEVVPLPVPENRDCDQYIGTLG